jgi:hypothetical protein
MDETGTEIITHEVSSRSEANSKHFLDSCLFQRLPALILFRFPALACAHFFRRVVQGAHEAEEVGRRKARRETPTWLTERSAGGANVRTVKVRARQKKLLHPKPS